ncbi:MAG TPA: ATP-binding cassette domain-containing protein [Chthoniobacterales bacterium]|jgi:phospholipid/cholesterol/gamma-HCH transport system ATP-binding protein|nr:ATP-binding cassette domain-containing protein [Chthoniobacterales bacterium]
MSETPLVHIENVVLRFGEKTVLDEVDLKVFSGDRLVVLGQSGSGKSTMLRLILGILKPTSGVVRYRHLQVQKLSRSKLNALRRRIGMVYQYSALISSMTVRQNLALPVEELGRKTRTEINHMIKENLEAVGMSGTEEKMPSELSGGMRKRVSLARALMMQPELILFDEPSAGLDPVISSVIHELIIGLTDKTKATSVIVTHEMESAFKVATRMAMLYNGKIIEDGPPELFRESKDPVVHQFVTGTAEGPITEIPSHADSAE